MENNKLIVKKNKLSFVLDISKDVYVENEKTLVVKNNKIDNIEKIWLENKHKNINKLNFFNLLDKNIIEIYSKNNNELYILLNKDCDFLFTYISTKEDLEKIQENIFNKLKEKNENYLIKEYSNIENEKFAIAQINSQQFVLAVKNLYNIEKLNQDFWENNNSLFNIEVFGFLGVLKNNNWIPILNSYKKNVNDLKNNKYMITMPYQIQNEIVYFSILLEEFIIDKEINKNIKNLDLVYLNEKNIQSFLFN